MHNLYNWKSIAAFFSALNENVEYIVLRNYEDFVGGRLFNAEHPDIDVLCRHPKKFIAVAHSTSRNSNKKDLIHQQVKIRDTIISLDVRYIGDGYYDERWEYRMLSQRRFFKDLCYVMDEEDYFYSLLYHVLIQKTKVSDDYRIRLEAMAKDINSVTLTQAVSLETLQTYMREKHYSFTYPKYPGTIANFSNVDKTLVKMDVTRIFNRFFFRIKRRIISILK